MDLRVRNNNLFLFNIDAPNHVNRFLSGAKKITKLPEFIVLNLLPGVDDDDRPPPV